MYVLLWPFALIFKLSPIATADSSVFKTVGPINGNWALMEYSCTAGELTAKGKQTNHAILTGRALVKTTITNGKESTTVKTWGPKAARESYCLVEMRGDWAWSDSEIKMHNTKVRRKAYGGAKCKHLPNEKRTERLHKYVLQENRLKVTLTSGVPILGESTSFCESGNTILVYLKI